MKFHSPRVNAALTVTLIVATAFQFSAPAIAQHTTPQHVKNNAPTETALSMKVSAATIERLLKMELSDRRTIQEYVSGTFIRGTTLTNAKANLRVVPSSDSAAFDLVIESDTTADSVGYNQATRNIGVNVAFSTFTRATTTKRIFLTDRGILVTPAQSWASTSMTIHNVDVFAGGLFKRLKRRMAAGAAWRKLMQEKTSQEQQISQRVAAELNAMADAKAKETLAPANAAYKKYFLNGFYHKGRLPGKFLLQTTPEALALTVLAPADAVNTPGPRINSPERGQMSAHVHAAVLNRFTESLMAGVEFYSGEIAEMVAFIAQTGEVVPRDDSFKIKLRENNPVEFDFEGNAITMRLFVTSLTPKGQASESGAIIETRFLITREAADSVRIRRDGAIAVLPLPPAPRPSSLLQRAIDYYFNHGEQVLDRRFVFGNLPGPMANLGTLEVKDLTLGQGWLMFETSLKPASATSAGATSTDRSGAENAKGAH